MGRLVVFLFPALIGGDRRNPFGQLYFELKPTLALGGTHGT
jgi:hypothetical protein